MERMSEARLPWDSGGSADYSSPYQDIADAIILQAVKDYKKTLRAIWKKPKSKSARKKLIDTKAELEDFFYSSNFQMYCDIDPDRLMSICRVKAIEDEKKAIARRNKRKINEMKKMNE